MPSFILRQLDPEFWAKVQAKAAAEGTTVKAVILRLLAAWLAAVILLSVTGCAYKNPTAPTVDGPHAGLPTRIELNATPGQGVDGGSGRISARVFDAFSTGLPDQTVTFTASAGTLSASNVVTDEKGMARATLTAPPGAGVVIHAKVGPIDVQTLIAIQP